MVRGTRCVAFCTAILALGLVARADDTVANPAYESWAKAKVGTVVKYSQASEAMGNKTSGEITDTLKELTPDAAKVEMKTSMTVAGNKMDLPPNTLTIQAKVAGATGAAPAGDAPKADTTAAKEDVVIDGKTYSCKVTTVNSDANGMKTTSKTWTCDDVPGSLVKSESNTTGSMTSSSTMTLISVEAK